MNIHTHVQNSDEKPASPIPDMGMHPDWSSAPKLTDSYLGKHASTTVDLGKV